MGGGSAVRKSGKKAYNLQYRRKTKQFVKAIPSDQVALFEESTRTCRAFLELVQTYVDREAAKARKETDAAKTKRPKQKR